MKQEQLKIPYHLGIILDGNRRWAKERGLPSFEGHKKGFETVKEIVKAANERGVKTLTIFCFSTENWNRSKEEVSYLMNILENAFKDYFSKFKDQDFVVKVIGQKDRLSEKLKKEIETVEKESANNKGMVLNLAISYGGRAELVEAIKSIIRKGINPDEITENTIKENLWTSEVDLVIRTGGEQRLSGFLLWQAAYSEFIFVKKYWPDFGAKDLDDAILEYNSRQRRFGK